MHFCLFFVETDEKYQFVYRPILSKNTVRFSARTRPKAGKIQLKTRPQNHPIGSFHTEVTPHDQLVQFLVNVGSMF